eukprot:TRINITY_DN16726_c0_g1_i2.p1 TRINITY_DN16726_c0_g1~~TRINITY_DN16726_c0_g1_i2.p1  ORF type:complete len:209 (+),score=51.67 TRINITY_DN16726_c0_g1_i2:184-810(+)
MCIRDRKYFFCCRCQRCVSPLGPHSQDGALEAFRCQRKGCQAVVLCGSDEQVLCEECGECFSRTELLAAEEKIKTLHNKAIRMASERDQFREMESAIRAARRILGFPENAVGFGMLCAARILAEQVGDHASEFRYLEEILSAMKNLYGENHYLLVEVYKKGVVAAGRSGLVKEGMQMLTEAKGVLDKSHGPAHEYTQSLSQMEEILTG